MFLLNFIKQCSDFQFGKNRLNYTWLDLLYNDLYFRLLL